MGDFGEEILRKLIADKHIKAKTRRAFRGYLKTLQKGGRLRTKSKRRISQAKYRITRRVKSRIIEFVVYGSKTNKKKGSRAGFSCSYFGTEKDRKKVLIAVDRFKDALLEIGWDSRNIKSTLGEYVSDEGRIGEIRVETEHIGEAIIRKFWINSLKGAGLL